MEPTIRWIFTNVILALTPILINFILIKVLKIGTPWHQAFKDGELFIFSTTLSASSIGIASFQGTLKTALGSLIFWVLLLVLILSTVLFSLASFIKLKQEKIPDERLFAATSISCAAFASICSYIIAFISGTI